MEIDQFAVALILAVVAALPGIAALFAQRKKIKSESIKADAEAAEIIQRAAFTQMEQYKKQRDEDKKRMDELEELAMELKERVEIVENELRETLDYLETCIEGANKLYNQVKKQNDTPEYIPPASDIISYRRKKIFGG